MLVEIAGPDGRTLEVDVGGPETGDAVLFHTGTPSAGRLFARHVDAGVARGLRHIGYSRPGYGISDRAPSRTVADCVVDVVAVADHLGIERFFTVGWSGGGPHALACAALLGERIIAAATLASVAPRRAAGLDWLAGTGDENLEEFAAADAGPEQLARYLEQHAPEFQRATGPDLHAALGDLLSAVDIGVLTGEFADYLARAARAGLERGYWGWFDDDMAFAAPWGFELGAIARPVTIWHGGQDRFVPFAHGEWLAAHVAGVRAQLHPDHGHLSLVLGSYGDVLDDLLALEA